MVDGRWLWRRKEMTKKNRSPGTRRRRSPSAPQGAAALKLALEAMRKKLSSDEAFYEKVVWRFQEHRPMTQEKAWDEIDDFLEKADLIAEVMVEATKKK
jgi:hypothetical protein